MRTITFIVIALTIVWWIIFFMLLPVGVRTEQEPIPGQASSAPANPNIGKKILWTSVIAIPLTSLFFYLLHKGYLDFIALR